MLIVVVCFYERNGFNFIMNISGIIIGMNDVLKNGGLIESFFLLVRVL